VATREKSIALSYPTATLTRAGRSGCTVGLKGFGIDKDLVGRDTMMGPAPKTLRPIFRDREDFSGGHTLKDATIAALGQSATLIVLYSPVFGQEPYVNEEVRLFKSRHPDRRVIPVIIEGIPPENFPTALRYEVMTEGTVTGSPGDGPRARRALRRQVALVEFREARDLDDAHWTAPMRDRP
jgi:TIR domain